MKTEEYSTQDLDRYLRKGYAFASLGGKRMPVAIQQVYEAFTNDSPEKAIRFAKVFRPNSKGNSNSWANEVYIDIKLDEIDFTPIRSGIYNYRDRAIYVSRGAERQYNMAINTNSYACRSCNPELPAIRNPSINLPKTLEAVRNNTYYPTDTAISRIRNGKRFVAALNSKFWLSVDRYSENLLIGCGSNNIVGKIKPDNTAVVFKGFEFLMESLTQLMPIGGIEDAG